jgi:predicted transposase/invertase (TIGR01784 family)
LDEWIYFLKNEEIKENFAAKGLKEAEEKLSIMKMPEDEQKAYEHYKDDLYYQASMFESSFGDGFYEGKTEGINEATKNLAINLVKKAIAIEIIAEVTGLSKSDIKQILQKAGEQ